MCAKTYHCCYQTHWVVWCVGGKNPIWRLSDTVSGHCVKHAVNTDQLYPTVTEVVLSWIPVRLVRHMQVV